NDNFDILYPIEYLLNGTSRDKNNVRISKANINPFFVQWLRANKEKLPKTVVVDFGFMEKVEDNIIAESTELVKLLEERNIVIMSGSVPPGLPVSSDEDYEFKRVEKELFNNFKGIAPASSKVIFGDYSSVSPALVTGGMAIVQIKYTL